MALFSHLADVCIHFRYRWSRSNQLELQVCCDQTLSPLAGSPEQSCHLLHQVPPTRQSTTPAWARTSPSRPSCQGGGRRWVWEPCPCGTAWPGCPPRWPLPALCHPAAEPRLLWSPHSPRMLPEIWTHRCLVTLVTPFTLTRAHTHAHTHLNDVRKYMHIHKESERLRTSQIITLLFFLRMKLNIWTTPTDARHMSDMQVKRSWYKLRAEPSWFSLQLKTWIIADYGLLVWQPMYTGQGVQKSIARGLHC